MAKVLNTQAYKAMERDLADALAQGKSVSVTIDIGYPPGGGVRPNSLTVRTKINGVNMKPLMFEQ